MSLFVLASKDGWVDIMYDGLDAVGVDQQVGVLVSHCQKPKKEACLFWRLLFLKNYVKNKYLEFLNSSWTLLNSKPDRV